MCAGRRGAFFAFAPRVSFEVQNINYLKRCDGWHYLLFCRIRCFCGIEMPGRDGCFLVSIDCRSRAAEKPENDGVQSARCEEVARYMIENGATVRNAAAKFGISKSTVHKEMTTRLRYVSYPLFLEVREVLETNKAERHIRGGEATRKKYVREKAEVHGDVPDRPT